MNFAELFAAHSRECDCTRIFLTEQNRFLLFDKDSAEPTGRGQSILTHTPMQRFGSPDDLVGATMWLISPASAFVTGTVIPLDGGFSAFGGV